MKTAIHWVSMMLAAGLLTGCGFELRGGGDLPPAMKSVHVQPGPATAATLDELRQIIESSGGQVLKSRQGASGVLRITGDDNRRRVLTVKSSGKVNEYSYEQTLRFQLADAQGKELAAEQAVQVQRDFLFDEQDVIGHSREEGALLAQMRRDAVHAMLRKIRAQLK
jgi:LPS-assembly lipoprotein